MNIRTIIFDDETQTAWYIIQDDTCKPAARRVKEHIKCPKEYFKRKLMGK